MSDKKFLISFPVVALVLVLLLLAVFGGAAFYYYVEGLAPVDAFYFASMTLATVGYGDFVPKSDIGKLFTAIYAFVGIGLFFGSAAIVFQTAVARINRLHQNYKDSHKEG